MLLTVQQTQQELPVTYIIIIPQSQTCVDTKSEIIMIRTLFFMNYCSVFNQSHSFTTNGTILVCGT